MTILNRLISVFVLLTLLLALLYVAILPFDALVAVQSRLADWQTTLLTWREAGPTRFIIAQVATVVIGLLILGTLLWMETGWGRSRGVRIQTSEGGTAELATETVGQRLAWHLDQIAEIISVEPTVRARGSAVDVRLDVEAAPDVDVPLKTDEVVDVTRELIEHEMGLRLGRLDVHIRCAPFDPEWD